MLGFIKNMFSKESGQEINQEKKTYREQQQENEYGAMDRQKMYLKTGALAMVRIAGFTAYNLITGDNLTPDAKILARQTMIVGSAASVRLSGLFIVADKLVSGVQKIFDLSQAKKEQQLIRSGKMDEKNRVFKYDGMKLA